MAIHFVFDTGAAFTMLNKNLAESRGWEKFDTGLKFGSYIKEGPPLVCDLRKIPKLSFGVRQVDDLVVATPVNENEKVSNILGRNFIDGFHFGVDQEAGKIYFKERTIANNPNISFSRIAQSITDQAR